MKWVVYQIEDFDSIESEPRDAILNIGLDNAHNVQEHRVVDLKKISFRTLQTY